MSINRHYYRAIYAALIIIAFFIPAYSNISAFRFLLLAIASLWTDSEITIIDLLVIVLPLLLVPATALLIFVKAIRQKSLNTVLLGLPFFSIAFFFLILSFDMNRQINASNVLTLMTQMSIGFYLAAAASVLLLFSYSRREALNLDSGR